MEDKINNRKTIIESKLFSYCDKRRPPVNDTRAQVKIYIYIYIYIYMYAVLINNVSVTVTYL